MQVQAEDQRSAVDLCRAIVDEDAREWDRIVKAMFERFGGPERTLAALVAMVLGHMPGDSIERRRRLLELRDEWPVERGPVRVSAPVDAHFEVA